MSLSRPLVFILPFFVLASLAIADIENAAPPNALKKGSQAVNFGVGYDLTLSAFRGQAFAYQWFLKDGYAARVGFELSHLDFDRTQEKFELYNDMPGYGEQDGLEIWEKLFSIDLQVLMYRERDHLDLYFGLGPRYSHSHHRSDESRFDWYDYDFVQSREARERKIESIGAMMTLGVRLPFGGRYSVQAEYGGIYTHTSDDEVVQYWDEGQWERSYLKSTSRSYWSYVSYGGRLSLSVFL